LSDERSVQTTGERPAQAEEERANRAHHPLVTDWSHHRLIFSTPKPNSPEAARVLADKRYQQQLLRRNAAAHPVSSPLERHHFGPAEPADPEAPGNDSTLHRDWTSSTGNFSTEGNNQYPAKYQFDPAAAPSCTGDFVVFDTGTTSSTSSGNVAAVDIGFFFSAPATNSVITITPPPAGPAVSFTAEATATGLTATQYFEGANARAAATNLALVITAYGKANPTTFPYSAATFFGSAIIVTDNGTAAGNTGATGNNTKAAPVCFSFFGFGNCPSPDPNFTFFSANFFGGQTLAGATAGVANLVALNELYSGSPSGGVGGLCDLAGPSSLFAEAVSTVNGTTKTSPGLSLDGTKIATVESSSSGSVLHIVKWAAGGSLTAPVAPNPTASFTAAGGCPTTAPAPCMVTVALGTTTDTNSAPFTDYTNDMIYVGDDNGVLYAIQDAFVGTTPAVVWKTTIDSGAALTGPVYDSGTSGMVFVADANGIVSAVKGGPTGGGGLITYNTAPGCAAATCPIPDPPIVDSTEETVTVFQGDDNSNPQLGGPFAVLYQLNTALSEFGQGGWDVGLAGVQLHDGDFDNNYYMGDYSTGHLYYCAKDPTSDDIPAIQQASYGENGAITSISVNVGTAAGALDVGSVEGGECSPLTEVYNTNITPAGDYMFFSVQEGGGSSGSTAATNCLVLGGSGKADSNPSGGCVMSIMVSDAAGAAVPTTVNSEIGEPGGSSGIITDNTSASGEASSIYFTPLEWVNPTVLGQATSATFKPTRNTAPNGAGTVTFVFPAPLPAGVGNGATLVTSGFAPAGYNFTSANTTVTVATGTIVVTVTANPGANGSTAPTTLGNGEITSGITVNGNCGISSGCAVKATQAGLQ
jgi:hypothetical protein